MILPCIDLMGGKVVQLVQGREKALEGDSPLEMLRRFAAFPQIQVIDLDAAIGSGSNDELVSLVASHALCRVGGGVRGVERARALVEQGAHRVIVGTAAFHTGGVNCRSRGPGPAALRIFEPTHRNNACFRRSPRQPCGARRALLGPSRTWHSSRNSDGHTHPAELRRTAMSGWGAAGA